MAFNPAKLLSYICAIAACITILAGCTSLKTFPQAARAGDTITLALGSADGMSRTNTTASFTSDTDSSVHDITSGIRGIFKLYADKASGLYSIGSTTNFIANTSGHEPWLTVMAVDLPTTLPTGTGTVQVTTTATYPTIGSHINNLPINLEIVTGVGAPADLPYEFGVGTSLPGDLSLLEALPHAQIIPAFPSTSTWPAYGAIEMNINVPTTTGAGIRFVVDDMRVIARTGLNMMWTARDTNQDLTIFFTNARGKLRDFHPRLSIVLVDQGDPAATFTATPIINSVNYFDIDGNPAVGPPISDFTVEMR